MQLLTISAGYKQSLTILTIKTAVTRVLCQAATHWLVSRAYVTRASIQTVIITDPPPTVRASEACHAAASRFPYDWSRQMRPCERLIHVLSFWVLQAIGNVSFYSRQFMRRAVHKNHKLTPDIKLFENIINTNQISQALL